MGYIELMTAGAVALLVLALLGCGAAWGLARLMDRANSRAWFPNTRFAGVLDVIERDPLATAVYYGARWVGICLLIGWLFSKPV